MFTEFTRGNDHADHADHANIPRIKPICVECSEPFAAARRKAGYNLCLPCGETHALRERKHWTVAPMHKSNYLLITDRADLLGINNKGGLVK